MLTRTHLLILNENSVVTTTIELANVANMRVERHHSFRHRGLGMIAALLLLIPSLWSLMTTIAAGNWAVLGTHLGLAILFGLLFGTLFLYGVLSSEYIPWLRVAQNGVEKLIPLPGTQNLEVERFLSTARGVSEGVSR